MNANVPSGAVKAAAMNKPLPNDPAWLVEALKLDGIKETPGAVHNSEVVKLFAESGHPGIKDDETAWCAVFVGAMLARGGYAGTGKLNARSYLDFGDTVAEPQRGDIVVFPRGNSAWQGHVAFVLKADAQYVYAFGGNQNNAVNVTRYSRANVLGFRRPRHRIGTDLIEQVQSALRKAGYIEVGPADGIMGPKTRAAIIKFQREHGMAATGQASKELLAAALAAILPPSGIPPKPGAEPAPAPPIPAPKPAQPTTSKAKGIAGWVIVAVLLVVALIIAAFTIPF